MEEFVLFIMTFVFLFVIYQVVFIVPAKKRKEKTEKKSSNKNQKELLEIRYLKSKYSLDMNKVPYNQLLQLCAIISCLDMAIAVSIVSHIDSFLWEIVIGIVSIFLLIFVSYHLLYLFYKKKGMVKDGKHK